MDIKVHEERVVTRVWVTRLSEEERNKLRTELQTLIKTANGVLPDGTLFPATIDLINGLMDTETAVEEDDHSECCG